MHEFFKGWRRKAGIVTLGLACVFAAGWVRSWTTRDNFYISRTSSNHAFASADGSIRLGKRTPAFDDGNSAYEWISFPLLPREDLDYYWRGADMEWRWELCGFDFGVATSTVGGQTTRIERWVIPYWSLVLPLTLLSAWLLLVKPQKVNEPEPAPTSET